MPVTWKIQDQILIVTVIEDWTGGGPASAITTAMESPQFKAGTPLLLDVRQSKMDLSAGEIEFRAGWFAGLHTKGLSNHMALLIGSKPLQHGLARMAKSYFEMRDVELRIFVDLDEALRWLQPVSQ